MKSQIANTTLPHKQTNTHSEQQEHYLFSAYLQFCNYFSAFCNSDWPFFYGLKLQLYSNLYLSNSSNLRGKMLLQCNAWVLHSYRNADKQKKTWTHKNGMFLNTFLGCPMANMSVSVFIIHSNKCEIVCYCKTKCVRAWIRYLQLMHNLFRWCFCANRKFERVWKVATPRTVCRHYTSGFTYTISQLK